MQSTQELRRTSFLLYLSQLTDLFRQASDLRIGDTARVLMGHVVYQGVHLSGQVPVKKKKKKQATHTLNHHISQVQEASFLLCLQMTPPRWASSQRGMRLLTEWCEANNLLLNTSKTKKVLVVKLQGIIPSLHTWRLGRDDYWELRSYMISHGWRIHGRWQ